MCYSTWFIRVGESEGKVYTFVSTCEQKISRSCFSNFRHHIPFLLLLLLLLLSKRPSALLKLSKGVIFTPIASTDARGVHRHQAIVILSLYHSKRIHCLLPKAALLNDAILFASHAFARTRSSRYGRRCMQRVEPTDGKSHVPSKLLGSYEQSLIGENRKHWYLC